MEKETYRRSGGKKATKKVSFLKLSALLYLS